MSRDTAYGLTALAVLFAALLAHHLWGHGGHFGFDDMHYARWAKLMAEGRFRTTDDHYSFRWGMIAPHAVAYRLFGVSDHSSAIAPMLATLLTLWCVWLLTASLPTAARVWAMAFTAFSEWVFFYSNKIMPDVLVMCWVTLAFYGYWKSRPLTTALALFMGFLTKETVALVAPVLAVLMLLDFLQGRNRSFWLWTTGIGAGLLVAYLIGCAPASGHPLARFQAIAANSYFNPCSYDQLPMENTLRRIGYELWGVFLNTGVLLGAVFVLPVLFGRAVGALSPGLPEHNRLLFIGAAMLLASNFMSTSLKAYVPLCLDIRHYLFAIPFVGAAAAVGIHIWLERPVRWLGASHIGLAALAGVVAWYFFPEGKYVYPVLAAVPAASLFIRGNKVIWALLWVPLLVKPVQVMQNALQSNYPDQKALVFHYLDNPIPNTLVISNPAECNIDAYLLGFDSSAVQFVPFSALTPERRAQADTTVLILNGLTAWMSNMGWEDYPQWVREPDSTRVLLGQQGGVEWYGLPKKP